MLSYYNRLTNFYNTYFINVPCERFKNINQNETCTVSNICIINKQLLYKKSETLYNLVEGMRALTRLRRRFSSSLRSRELQKTQSALRQRDVLTHSSVTLTMNAITYQNCFKYCYIYRAMLCL